MRVVASPEAVAFVRERGGRLFMWPRSASCCRSVTWLESSRELRADRVFRRVPADGVDFGEACGRLYLAALYVPGVALSARIAS